MSVSFERFKELAQAGLTGQLAPYNGAEGGRGSIVVPVWYDYLLDTDTPVSAFAKLKAGHGTPSRFAFLLESAPAGSETWSRYTFMGADPHRAWRLKDGVVEDWTSDSAGSSGAGSGWQNARRPADPLEDLNQLITQLKPVDVPELANASPFWNGAVGFFSYDVVRLIEKLPGTPKVRGSIPDALFVFTRSLVIMDNLKSQARVVIGVQVNRDSDLAALYDAAQRDITAIVGKLQTPRSIAPLSLDSQSRPAEGKSNYEKAKFLQDVEKVKEYIRAGDVFQALLARRIDVPHDFASDSLYRAIRAINPSPYMYHLILDGVELVGSSPELLVRMADGKVTVRPIAGTRRRDGSANDDLLAADLLSDEKERAEHVMLVDLGRNDVGRVAKFGSVEVSDLMHVEKYSHVLHIVSNVEGDLQEGCGAMDVFRATFPAGTMTGAPKVRAMEIIDEMEPDRRGPYAGAVGYIAAGGTRMDLAITIRTCVIADGVASVQAGAGIVADSIPENEWDETENKARAMLTAIGQVRK